MPNQAINDESSHRVSSPERRDDSLENLAAPSDGPLSNFRKRDKMSASLTSHGARSIDSDSLFGGNREIFIQHGEDTYRLLKTKNGKLILNK